MDTPTVPSAATAETFDAVGPACAADLLTAAPRAAFARDGWVVLPDALPEALREAMAGWVDEIAAAAGPGNSRLHYYEQTATGEALCRTERYIEDHAALAAMITRGTLPALAGELIGEPATIYKEKINYKAAGGAGFNAHQDASAYAFIKRHITCMVAVDAMTLDNGCLEFSPLGDETMLPDDGDGCIAPGIAASLPWQAIEVPIGGVVFFTSYAPHRSGPNLTSASRRAIYLTYNATSEGDKRAEYYLERERAISAHGADGSSRISTIGHFQGRAAQPGTDRIDSRRIRPPSATPDAQHFVDALLDWMAQAGASNYDESVTQWQHALQSASLAAARGNPPSLVAAALLHDVGHLLADEHDANGDFLERDLEHEALGARWLERSFVAAVTEPVRFHVPAKRYLCAVDPSYHDTLSESSKRSLRVQGGAMNAREIAAFEANPYHRAAVELRRIDDLAKVSGRPTPDAARYRHLLVEQWRPRP
ncbi:MAG: phytanoyl-CoA dioxygenase family protein [Proteobacteria bacterium]|nr:phytanoyl-CoA dioxygenase family protein [Burkholderiales bacterium]